MLFWQYVTLVLGAIFSQIGFGLVWGFTPASLNVCFVLFLINF